DAPDGQWNRNTVIWAETRILFTGSYANARFYSGDLAAPSPVSSFVVDSPTPGPATSQKVLVNFSDASLNLPAGTGTPTFSVTSSNGHAGAAYSVGPAPVEASRLNQVMTFTQQYCSEPNLGSTCSNVCPTAPCYVVTNVGACNAARTTCTGFSYGASGQVTITGVSAGTDTVTATVTAGGGAASVSLPGVVR
ncbi:MAG TPA: hypothetical protein VFM53_02975, partial [Anaeromyxobacteraceae bacterium]|nr:hypothetical protein [Anaeromyxobacteraceae bacterium]